MHDTGRAEYVGEDVPLVVVSIHKEHPNLPIVCPQSIALSPQKQSSSNLSVSLALIPSKKCPRLRT